MAQASAAPWSRWDAPGFQFVSSNTAPPMIQYDTGVSNAASFVGEGGTIIGASQVALVGQRPNADNPDFLDCIYGAPNTAARYVELCLRDNGCCSMGCCENTSWEEKYRWALALIIIFCILVIVVVAVSLFCWLINRAKDKRQKKLLLGSSQGLSSTASQVSVAGLPAGKNAAGYNPYVDGPKQPY